MTGRVAQGEGAGGQGGGAGLGGDGVEGYQACVMSNVGGCQVQEP